MDIGQKEAQNSCNTMQRPNKTQEKSLLQKQNLSVSEQPQEQNIAEQQQNLQKEQQTVTTTQDENTINTITEPEVPYTI